MLRKALINGKKSVLVCWRWTWGARRGDDLFQCHLDPWRRDTAQLNRIGPTAPLSSTAREFCTTRTHTGPDSRDPIISIWSAFRLPLPPKTKNSNDLNQNKPKNEMKNQCNNMKNWFLEALQWFLIAVLGICFQNTSNHYSAIYKTGLRSVIEHETAFTTRFTSTKRHVCKYNTIFNDLIRLIFLCAFFCHRQQWKILSHFPVG